MENFGGIILFLEAVSYTHLDVYKRQAGCSRDVIKEGADMLGWDLNKLFEESILAMRSCEAAVAEAMKKAEA